MDHFKMGTYHQDKAGAPPVKSPTLASELEAFDPLIGRLENLAASLLACGDRITGSRPSGVENAKDVPTPSHLIYSIQARRERLLRVVNYMEEEIQRLENSIS